jgi:hypothetical protein
MKKVEEEGKKASGNHTGPGEGVFKAIRKAGNWWKWTTWKKKTGVCNPPIDSWAFSPPNRVR